MRNVTRLNLSLNRWLQCDHLNLLANRMPAVIQLRINKCVGLIENNNVPSTDRFLEIVDRNYGLQLTSFSCAMTSTALQWNGIFNVHYNYADNMMVRLMSSLSNVTTFDMEGNAVLCPNSVIAGMLVHSPDIRVLLYARVVTDAETETFMSVLSACRNLTTLSLMFVDHRRISTVPLKAWMFRSVFNGLTNLKHLVLDLHRASVEDEDGYPADGHHQNPSFLLNCLIIGSKLKLHPFLRSLIFSQIGGVELLLIHGPDFTEIFPDLFGQQRPYLRRLSIGCIDYSAKHFSAPEGGYRHILSRAPVLSRLLVKTENKPPDHDDTELLEALAWSYPNCKVNIDDHELSIERRRAIAAQCQSLQE